MNQKLLLVDRVAFGKMGSLPPFAVESTKVGYGPWMTFVTEGCRLLRFLGPSGCPAKAAAH